MITINKDLCIGCGCCITDCFNSNIKVVDGKAEAGQICFNCGHCLALCPMKAISIPEYRMDEVEELSNSRNISPENLLYNIKARRSVRKYSDKPVERDKLESLLQAGRYTATAKNLQGNTFIFVQEKLDVLRTMTWKYVESFALSDDIPEEMRAYTNMYKKLKHDGEDRLFRNAPAVLFIANELNLDAGLAAQNIENMACALGMGALYNGYLCRLTDRNEKIREWLGINNKPIRCCMLLGYSEMNYLRTVPRRKADAIWL